MYGAAAAAPLAIVGRQPIYDRRLRVFGYELLFRLDGSSDRAEIGDGEACTARVVVSTFVDIGLENVVGGALAFVNVNRGFLLSDVIHTLPHERVVLEILEDVPPDPDVLTAIQGLVRRGYRIALDDFAFDERTLPLVDLATIVKLDLSETDASLLGSRVADLKARGLSVVAERVETREDMERCRQAGFDLFQGYFLARPATLQRQRPPSGHQFTALEILSLLNTPNASVDQLETAISRDVTLSYRLLRVINSAAFGIVGRIDSLRQAIVHLGRDRIRSWVNLLVLSGMSDKPPELLATALVRARMCEHLAEEIDAGQAQAYFMAGLFSVLDAVLDTPMDQLVSWLPLAPSISEALVARAGPIGNVLNAVIAYERCEWEDVECIDLQPAQVRDAYLSAVRWSLEVSEHVAA